jgi:hypothetical protein
LITPGTRTRTMHRSQQTQGWHSRGIQDLLHYLAKGEQARSIGLSIIKVSCGLVSQGSVDHRIVQTCSQLNCYGLLEKIM